MEESRTCLRPAFNGEMGSSAPGSCAGCWPWLWDGSRSMMDPVRIIRFQLLWPSICGFESRSSKGGRRVWTLYFYVAQEPSYNKGTTIVLLS